MQFLGVGLRGVIVNAHDDNFGMGRAGVAQRKPHIVTAQFQPFHKREEGQQGDKRDGQQAGRFTEGTRLPGFQVKGQGTLL